VQFELEVLAQQPEHDEVLREGLPGLAVGQLRAAAGSVVQNYDRQDHGGVVHG
jgi:hypothetical protein